ncbi:MAG: hypothetical protein KDB37_20265, partial [Ilumatobacter sp.]|nr:hypothetical protein [Ilumatobacter sp.]
MLEEVSGVELARGPGFYSFFTDSDGEKGVKAAPGETGAPWLIVGALTAVASMLVAEADWTILSRFRATSDFTASNGRVSTIGVFGGVVTVSLTESATGWTPTVAVLTSDGIKILTGAEITYDEAVTHTIATRWDDDGDLELLVQGESADTEDVQSIDIYESPSLAAYNGAPAGLAIMQQLGWDRALTDDEIGEFSYVFQSSAWEFAYDFNETDSFTLDGDGETVELIENQGYGSASNRLVEATVGDGPRTGVRSANGNNLLDFDGTAEALSMTGGTGIQPGTAAGSGIVILTVVQRDGTTRDGVVSKLNTTVAGGRYGLFTDPGTTLYAIWAGPSGSPSANVSTTHSSTALEVWAQRLVRDGASSVNQLWINGVKIGETTYTDSMANWSSSNILGVGTVEGGTTYKLDGAMGGVWIERANIPTEAQLAQAMQQLMTRFGIS